MFTPRRVEILIFIILCVVILLTVRPFSTSRLPVSISGKLVDAQSGLFLKGIPIRVSVVEDGEPALDDLEIARSGEGGGDLL